MEKVISKKLRTSRNKKKYWRKGPQLADVEQFMHDEHVDKSEGGVLRERADDALFTLDREPDDTTQKLTRKQLAALNKRKLLERLATN
ncbi:unnamed protein product [Anisakis simplex]|uniref:Ribosome biogenesis protein NOP53 n=1 Tax=Anisakis simplex TaxID=6269 RepID=A0A0M3KF08_ANISI|nr:unnamed protein product [Anisakis simplex]